MDILKDIKIIKVRIKFKLGVFLNLTKSTSKEVKKIGRGIGHGDRMLWQSWTLKEKGTWHLPKEGSRGKEKVMKQDSCMEHATT